MISQKVVHDYVFLVILLFCYLTGKCLFMRIISCIAMLLSLYVITVLLNPYSWQ